MQNKSPKILPPGGVAGNSITVVSQRVPSNLSHQNVVSSPEKTETNTQRNQNILCAVLALLKELDDGGLELVKRDIERKQHKRQ